MKRGLFLLVSLLLASRLDAATFYVSGASGSNANSCATAQSSTASNAKQTLAGALGCVTAANGDAILFHSGTYTSNANFINTAVNTFPSGTSFTNALTIGSAGDGTVTLQGAAPVLLYDVTLHYLIIQDLVIDANDASDEAVMIYNVDHIRVQRCTIKNGANFGAHADTAPYVELLNNTITSNGTHGLGVTNGHGVYGTTDHMLVSGNNVHANEGYGIHFNGGLAVDHPGNVIRNNLVHGNGLQTGTTYGILEDQNTDALVYNNIVYDQTASGAGGISVYSGSLNTGVYNNTVYNTSGECIALQYYGSAPTIQNNICSSTGSGIVDYGGGTGTPTISYNLDTFNSAGFTNAAGADFSLTAGASTALDAGTTIASVTSDYIGTSRPQGSAYDIGAYERISTPVQGPRFSPPRNTALTSECNVGEMMVLTSGTVGLYICTATNTWTIAP